MLVEDSLELIILVSEEEKSRTIPFPQSRQKEVSLELSRQEKTFLTLTRMLKVMIGLWKSRSTTIATSQREKDAQIPTSSSISLRRKLRDRQIEMFQKEDLMTSKCSET